MTVSRAVAIGGGHGLARTLAALPRIVDDVTAIVTVADDGGSSGRLRRDLDVVPPGDLRQALTTLARDPEMRAIVGYRFPRGELAGHSLGNLVLVALHELSDGDIVQALDRLAALLDVPGRVLPCTPERVTLHARTSGGAISGQVAVQATARLERVWLEPLDPPATSEAVAAVERADLVVLGPGSLYTSVLPNLLVPGLAAALASTKAPVVFVANLREQPGETQGMSLADHLDAIAAHVPQVRIDAVVAHRGAPPAGAGRPLTRTGHGELPGFSGTVVLADLLDGHDGHDPQSLARALCSILGAPPA